MPLKARHLLLLTLAACTPERPAGAYDPVWPEAGAECEPIPGIANPCGEPDAGQGTDDGDDVPGDDGNTDDGDPFDGGMEQDTGTIDPTKPLGRLAGNYLMRVDYYSTATGGSTVSIRVKNRVSNLFFTTLTVVDDTHVHAVEQLCAQSSAHRCETSSCSNWITSYDDLLPAKFREVSKIERDWEISNGKLSVPRGPLLPLGFDPQADPSKLPSDDADPSVWTLADDATRRGVRTFVTAKVAPAPGLPASISFSCNIGSVMVFGTEFEGPLETSDASGLVKFVRPVVADGTSALAVFAKGDPPSECTPEKLNAGDSADDKGFVRFKSAGKLTSCPTSIAAYEQAFPLPTNVNLDPPTN